MAAKTKKEELSFPQQYFVFAADLSLKRPGFCMMQIRDKKIHQVQTFCIDNKTNTTKPRGQILEEILIWLNNFFSSLQNKQTCFFVREKHVNSFGGNDSMSSKTAVASVVGISDLALWQNRPSQEWQEIYPVTIKKLITGSGRSDKKAVAKSLELYIGKREYACDDESDATAVAVSWLIQNGQINPINQEDIFYEE